MNSIENLTSRHNLLAPSTHTRKPRELRILPSGETQIARKRRKKKKEQDKEAARSQTLTLGRVTRPDHSTNYGKAYVGVELELGR
jgi:hypothetical protein